MYLYENIKFLLVNNCFKENHNYYLFHRFWSSIQKKTLFECINLTFYTTQGVRIDFTM